MDRSDIGQKTKLGIFYNTAARMAGTFGQIISTVILARLLAPQDFGVVATAMMVIGFATKFGEFGFHMGLIQRKEDIQTVHIDTLFVMDFAFKIVLWVIITLAAPAIAVYFQNPILEKLLPVIATYMLLECFSATPLTVLKRNMDFKSTSIIATIERFITIGSSILLASLGFSYWSLVYSKLLGVSTSGVLAMRKTGWLPRFRFDRQASRDLFRFGILISLRNLFRYGSDKVDYFFISRYLGSEALGLYEKAFELMRLPQRRITRAVNRVVFSAFSRIQDQPERIRMAFKKLILAISLVSYPMLAGLAFVAPLFIPIVLTPDWTPSVRPLQIMCFAGILRSMDPFLNSLLTTTGFVKSTVTRRAFEFVLLAVATFWGVKYGIVGVSIGIVVSYVIVMFLMLFIITAKTSVKWMDYFGSQIPAVVCTLGMLAVMALVTRLVSAYVHPDGVAMLLTQVVAGGVAYVALHLIFRFRPVVALYEELRGDTRQLMKRLKKRKQSARRQPVSTPE
ncbi:MAG: lipopolysaccharide biosynthesis protein [candidate division KSB1 bacterium]|nr:lipopolysaccharide biosynthesis protein [candidate division KSB1 bacterium]